MTVQGRRGWFRTATATGVGLAVIGGGALVFADHHDGGRAIRGVITAVTWTAPSTTNSGSGSAAAVRRWGDGGWSQGARVGTLTVLSPVTGPTTLAVLSTTRFEVTGGALASGLVGTPVAVRAVSVNGAWDAVNVGALESAETAALVIRGRVNAVGNGSISIVTDHGVVVTAALSPAATVTLADGSAGTLADITVGTRVAATWQVVGGQAAIVAIRLLGGDQNGQGQDH